MKKYKFLCFIIICTGLLFFSQRALADEVYLKNGSVLDCVIIEETAEGVTLQLKIGIVAFGIEKIEKIERATAQENEELLNRWAESVKRKRRERKEKIAEKQKKETLPVAKERVYAKNRRIYLDDELFFIKGVAYGINYPGCAGGMAGYFRIPFEIFEKDFKMMEEVGINCIRTYEPLPPELLDLAEEYNIMVIENIVYPGDWTDYKSAEELSTLKREAIRIVKRDKDRPCILMWSIWNDAPFTWGKHGGNVVKRFGSETVNDFLKEIYLAVKSEDTDHLVTGSNMMGHIGSDVGFDFLDVIGVNAYIGGHGQWLGAAKAKESILGLSDTAKKYNKPLVIMETGYSTYINEKLQYEVLKSQIEITNQHIAGLLIFQWSDGWWKAGEPAVHDDHIEEHWGVVTGYRDPKAGHQAILELFGAIPTKSKGYSPEAEDIQ